MNMTDDKNRRVLVIDDNRAIHDDFRKILCPTTALAAATDATETAVFGRPTDAVGQTQFEVDSAYQGQEGVLLVQKALAAGRPYALAIVDVRMPPGWDGVETTRKMWELDPDLQVVFCTAYSDYSWNEMFAKLGHHDGWLILKKPFDAVEAVQLAHALTEKWRLHQQSRRKMEELEGMVAERTAELRLLGSAVEQAKESILIVEKKPDVPLPKILFVNPAFTQLTGYTAEEAIGKTPAFLHGPGTDPALADRIQQYFKRGETFEGEIINYRKDGTEYCVEMHISPIRNGGEDSTLYVAIQHDITVRKRAETALRESETRYRALFDGSADGIVIADSETKAFKYANPALCRMLGYTEAELRTVGIGGIHPKADLPHVTAEFEAQARGEKTLAADLPCLRKDGSVFHADISAVKITIDGRPCNVGFFRDITERKQAEEALRQSEERFRQFADQSSEVIWFAELNPECILFVNRKVEEVWGLPPEHFYQNAYAWMAAIYPEDRSRVHEAWDACVQGRSPKYEAEYRVVRPDGSIRWVLDGGMPVRNDAGEIARLSGVARDITERKQAEEALRMFQFASDQAADAIFWLDQNAGFYYVNDEACCSLGYTREELMRLSLFDIDPFFPREKWEEDWKRFRGKQIDTLRMESRHRRKDGSLFPIEVVVKHLRFDGDELHLAFARDMTEHKRMEAELTYERDLLRTLLDHSPDKIYFKDTQSRFIKAGKAHVRQFGVASADELVGKTDFDFFTEEHARPAFEDEQEIIRTGAPVIGKVEKEVWQDGHETWCLTTKMPFRDKDGKIIGTFGVSKDITAMKETEAKLAHEQARFKFVFENMPVGVALSRHYPDGRLERMINDAHLRICGLTREQDQLPGIYKQITHPEDAARQAELVRPLDDGRAGQISLEKRYVRLDGTTVWVAFSFQRHNYSDGSFDELTLVVDITGMKQAEAERERLVVELQSALVSVKSLSGLLPICSGCKKIRDDKGYWSQVESYIQQHSEAKFSHGLCPDCIKIYFPEEDPGNSPKGAA